MLWDYTWPLLKHVYALKNILSAILECQGRDLSNTTPKTKQHILLVTINTNNMHVKNVNMRDTSNRS